MGKGDRKNKKNKGKLSKCAPVKGIVTQYTNQCSDTVLTGDSLLSGGEQQRAEDGIKDSDKKNQRD